MDGSIRHLAVAALVVLAMPLAAQQQVPMRGNTPVAPQGIRVPPVPDAPVSYETAEGQNIRVVPYVRGLQRAWSLASVSDDTILVTERLHVINHFAGPTWQDLDGSSVVGQLVKPVTVDAKSVCAALTCATRVSGCRSPKVRR